MHARVLFERLRVSTQPTDHTDEYHDSQQYQQVRAHIHVWPKIHKRLPAQTLSSAAIVDQRHLGDNSTENMQQNMDNASADVRPHGDEVTPTHTDEKRYTVGAVVVTRNDGYGGNLVERSTVALTRMLDVVDEVTIVDINSRSATPFIALLPDTISKSRALKSVVISPEHCSKELGSPCEDKLYEALGRNIGLRESTTDIIISTNPEVIFPSRFTLNKIIASALNDEQADAVILPRRDVSLNDGVSLAQRTDADENTEIVLNRNVNDWPVGSVSLMDVSIITNCGDFQMAHRKLWHLSGGFAPRHGHNFWGQ